MAEYQGAAEEILTSGYARVALDGDRLASLARAREEAARFFGRPEAEKRAYGSADFNFGFRPYGRQYSQTPDRPDVNESFTYWADALEAIPGHGDIAPLLRALSAYRATAAELAAAILGQFAERYSYPHALDFGQSSYLEVNWYLQSTDRDLLQDRHEDGHLLTLVASDGPGLEIEVSGQMEPVTFGSGTVLVMPGSLLEDMTGGEARPLYHQVRNHHRRRRMSALYLVNPPLDKPVSPYIVTDRNRGIDIAARARTNGAMFGLPEAPILPG
jgi:isopenicillin N synthase-like dioxygenase